jgi:glucokinase
MKAVFLGIEIGGTKVQVSAGSADGRIEATWRGEVKPRAGASAIRRQLLVGAREVLRGRRPAAVGVGFGGPVCWRTGRVRVSHHVRGWANFPLAAWLRGRLGAPVTLENDANVAALAEARLGVGRGRDPVFYMTVGSGIGGGLVAGGELYHGAEPGEMEVGHTRVPRVGRPAREWPILEELASGWAVDRAVRAAVRRRPRSGLARACREAGQPPAAGLWRAARRGDRAALEIWEGLASHLALGLSHAVHLAHPEVLVLGGGVSLMGEPLRRAVEGKLRHLVMAAHAGTWSLRLARLGEGAVPAGALLLAAGRLAREA